MLGLCLVCWGFYNYYRSSPQRTFPLNLCPHLTVPLPPPSPPPPLPPQGPSAGDGPHNSVHESIEACFVVGWERRSVCVICLWLLLSLSQVLSPLCKVYVCLSKRCTRTHTTSKTNCRHWVTCTFALCTLPQIAVEDGPSWWKNGVAPKAPTLMRRIFILHQMHSPDAFPRSGWHVNRQYIHDTYPKP